jgi:hypothetical protein
MAAATVPSSSRLRRDCSVASAASPWPVATKFSLSRTLGKYLLRKRPSFWMVLFRSRGTTVHKTTRLLQYFPQAPGRKPGFDVDAYASKLDPAAPALAPLAISADTLKEWKAGYSNSGPNRGRLAIALHDRDGNTIGFAGRALGTEQPSITIPNGINPQEIIFGSERVEEGTLNLVRDVLYVLKAHESGVSNCVCFLTEISAYRSKCSQPL